MAFLIVKTNYKKRALYCGSTALYKLEIGLKFKLKAFKKSSISIHFWGNAKNREIQLTLSYSIFKGNWIYIEYESVSNSRKSP